MTVSFQLNGEKVSVAVPASMRLVDLLKQEFGLAYTIAGCNAGTCGTCVVLLNNELVHSCLIPSFAVQDATVLTYEGIAALDGYKDIFEGFRLVGVEPCADCLQGKVLTVYALLAANPLPRREDMISAIGWHGCGCTDSDTMCRAIETIVNVRRYNRHAGR